MFLRVVDTIVTKEEVAEELYNEESSVERGEISDLKQEELFDIHGEPLRGESD